jgi:hypothetical protein
MVYWMEDNSSIKNRDFGDFVADSRLPGANACQDYSQVSPEKILHPDKASSFLDINGDCAPDFVLQTVNKIPTNKDYLEIYLYMTAIKKFCLVAIEPVSNTYAMASFADLSNRCSSRQQRFQRLDSHQLRPPRRHLPQHLRASCQVRRPLRSVEHRLEKSFPRHI